MDRKERKLYRFGELKRLIRECGNDLADVYAERNGFLDGQLKAPAPDRVKVMGGEEHDPVFDAVWKMIEVYDGRILRLQDNLNELWREHDGIRYEIDRAGLTQQERQYIDLRYVKDMPVAQVAGRMGYCERWCGKMRRAVLEKLG